MSDEADRKLEYLASALEAANATIRQKTDELSLVRRVGDAISSLAGTSALSVELVQSITERINCKYAALYAGLTGSPFQLKAVSSVFTDSDKFPENITESRVAHVLSSFQAPIQIDDLTSNAAWSVDWPFPAGLLSWLFVPLIEGRNVRGVLCLADDAPYAFNNETLHSVMMVVPQIASALAKIALYEGVRASETKYRTLVENMHDVVFICGRDWKIVDVNAASQKLFGESIIGRVFTDLFCSSATARQFSQRISKHDTVQNFEADLFTEKADRLVVLISCTAYGNRYSGVIKDVTERTQLIEQVIRAQKMESVGTLAAGVAHDFNNILGIILPNAELIQLRTRNDPSVSRFADVIINASRRANQLTKQLLALARKEPRQLRVLNLNEAIQSTSKLFENTIGKKIDVQLEFECDPASMRADDSQIDQILLNLAINARDAMPDGGTLRFNTRLEGKFIALRVSDTGSGIQRNILPKIFDPFFTTKEQSKGTGLGLSVVYSLVKELGGTIDVTSEVGRGTQFLLRFPVTTGVPEQIPPPQRLPAGGEQVLIVDDEPEMIDLLQTALSSLGYQVRAATNGQEAVDMVSAEDKLVIMDMMMPVMDGLTAIHAIRQKFPAMKILVASGYTHPENFPTLRGIGVEAFVQKPFEIRTLAPLIREILDGIAV